MKEYKSFGALARALRENLAALEVAKAMAMEISAVAIVGHAYDEIGKYQRDDMGPATPWPDLKIGTQKDRVRHGFEPDEPLLRSGEMRSSIEHVASATGLIVGSHDPIALYQEIGTNHIKPRAFLTPALHRNIPFIMQTVGQAIEDALSGKK